MICDRIFDDIPPQMKILNMAIPNLMRFYSLVSKLSVASRIKTHKGVRHKMKCGVINDVKLFPTVYRTIYCHKFLTLSNQTSRYKSKCIRITILRSKVLLNWTYGNETLQPYPDCYFVSRLASLPLLVYRGSFFFFTENRHVHYFQNLFSYVTAFTRPNHIIYPYNVPGQAFPQQIGLFCVDNYPS